MRCSHFIFNAARRSFDARGSPSRPMHDYQASGKGAAREGLGEGDPTWLVSKAQLVLRIERIMVTRSRPRNDSAGEIYRVLGSSYRNPRRQLSQSLVSFRSCVHSRTAYAHQLDMP